MPSRRDIFVNGDYYHIFNKTLDAKKVFDPGIFSQYFLELLYYYRSQKANIRYSFFKKLPDKIRSVKIREVNLKKYFKVNILAFSLLPNHFHLLVRQNLDQGIIRFMADTVNALTRFYNISKKRKGPLFLPQFRSRQILTQEQLIHVSRYVHLNPYSAGLMEALDKLEDYKLSSLHEYLARSNRGICQTEYILKVFNNDKNRYRQFVFDQADYQKKVEETKYTEKWI